MPSLTDMVPVRRPQPWTKFHDYAVINAVGNFAICGAVMTRMTTLRYVKEAIESFTNDPPANNFQRGYRQALIDVRDKK